MRAASPAPLDLAQISLRKAERGMVVGGVESGKSTLGELLGREFLVRYQREKARRLLLDTKPRYRAEKTAQGLSAKRLYRTWDHGPTVPGSMLVEQPSDLDLAWKVGVRTAIAQSDGTYASLPRLLAISDKFLAQSRTGRPQLAQVDETMDFYGPTGNPRGSSDVITRFARTGRERGTAALYGSQRTKGIPATLLQEVTRLYLFHLDYEQDMKRLYEMGLPEWVESPRGEHEFYYWWKRDREHVWGPYKLAL